MHNKSFKSPAKDLYITTPAFLDLFIFVFYQHICTIGWPFHFKMISLVFQALCGPENTQARVLCSWSSQPLCCVCHMDLVQVSGRMFQYFNLMIFLPTSTILRHMALAGQMSSLLNRSACSCKDLQSYCILEQHDILWFTTAKQNSQLLRPQTQLLI